MQYRTLFSFPFFHNVNTAIKAENYLIMKGLFKMANYNRTIMSSLWSKKTFRKLTPKEKVFYFLIHTGEITSDTSVFPCLLDDCALFCGVSVNEIKKMITRFEELGLIVYDDEAEEICVLDYFENHEPAGGITYEMYRKDFAKISSEQIFKTLVDNSKNYCISMPFFAALQDFVPELKEKDFNIKKSDKTVDEIRSAALRGRTKAKSKISAMVCEEQMETAEEIDVDVDTAVGELPF